MGKKKKNKKKKSCFSLAGLKTSVGYKDASGTDRTLELTIGTEEYNTVWSAFLTSFKTHLQEKGLFDKTVLYKDEIKEDGMKSIIALIKEKRHTEADSHDRLACFCFIQQRLCHSGSAQFRNRIAIRADAR